jgi:esterase
MMLRTVRMGEAAGAPPVVLLHGLFGAASNWGRIQRRLAETGPALAIDLRNHGASPHGAAMDYATMAADVIETLDHEGIAAAAVIGHSMGGKVAMQLALGWPGRVARMVVADIAPVTYPPHFRDIAQRMLALPLAPGLMRAEANAWLEEVAPDPAVRGFLLQNLRFGDPPAWRIGLAEIAAALPEIETWTAAGRYDGPVMVLRGERSDYVLPEYRPLFRALFPAARFATLRGAGHWLHADAPDAFLATVQAFLG